MTGFLRINRFGQVKTNKKSCNQCKDVGYKDYEYHVALVCCVSNTDHQEFIVDHAVIHNLVQDVFKKKMSSCEDLAKMVAQAIEKEAAELDIHTVDLYVKIKPVLTEPTANYAFMEYSRSGRFL